MVVEPISSEKTAWLNAWAEAFEQAKFIEGDPISVPHRYQRKEDIETAGFFAATLAWGQRKTIIKNALSLMERMDDKPFDFITQHQPTDLKALEGFVHRTFQTTDALFFIDALQRIYLYHGGLENVMAQSTVADGLENLNRIFFEPAYAPERSRKHVSTPSKKSACKRLNMFLRWMVRPATKGVDFGLWKSFKPNQLLCPLDVHVERTAVELGLLGQGGNPWERTVKLTNLLLTMDANDPVRYDFALFGMSWYQRVNGPSTKLWPPPDTKGIPIYQP